MNVVEGSRCKMMQILRQVNVYISIIAFVYLKMYVMTLYLCQWRIYLI